MRGWLLGGLLPANFYLHGMVMKKRFVLAVSCVLTMALLAGGVVALFPSLCGNCGGAVGVASPADEAEGLFRRARELTRVTEGDSSVYTAASFPLFLRAAELGHADAQYVVGRCFEDGLEEAGVEKDSARAAEWYARAVAQGHALAMQALAECYLHGDGVPEDQKRAFDLLHRSLEAGNQGVLELLAYCYFYGWGVEPDGERAIEYDLRACEHGEGYLAFFWVDRDEAVCRMEAETPTVRGEMEQAAQLVYSQMRTYLASRLPGEELPKQPQQLLARCIGLARQGDGEAAYRVARCLEEGYYISGEDADVCGMDGYGALAYYGMALEAGFDASLYALGQMYECSSYIPKDEGLSDFWYERAAECGDGGAAQKVVSRPAGGVEDDAFARACCRASALNPASASDRRRVDGVIRSGKVSMGMLRFLAGQGNREVMAYLGECYELGLQGEKPDAVRAVLCYRRAAAQGSPRAQFRLGCCYAEGRGVPKDLQKAAVLFEQAARAEMMPDEAGDSAGDSDDEALPPPYYGALRALAHCYAQGLGVDQSLPRALELYLLAGAADEGGSLRDNSVPAVLADMVAGGRIPDDPGEPALRRLCARVLLYVYENSEVAEEVRLDVLQRAARLGEPRACFLLSGRYGAGEGVPRDAAKSLEWLQRSAACGGAEAALELARRYESGEGVGQDMQRAAACYRQAAEAGLEEAWLRWGRCLAEGTGVSRNAAEAVRWYKKAFYRRDPDSVPLLAECYEKGEGVQRNAGLAETLRQLLAQERKSAW